MPRLSSERIHPDAASIAGQKGAALLLMMLIMVLGTSWALVGALNEASRNTVSEQKQTGDSLRLAKSALLGYIAQQALSSNHPGKFPCPESASEIGTNHEGEEPVTGCTTTLTVPAIGRLPWKTLGIDKLLDGAGEPLWYVVSYNVRAEPVDVNEPDVPVVPINYSIASAASGALTLDGTANAVVAMIIAPGAALNTASSGDTAPSPCVKRDQSSGRNASTLNPSDFVECGNATLAAFVSSRNDTWGNDRAVSVTASEMLSAIDGAVADRIQRFVVPVLNGSSTASGWYQNTSLSEWGRRFFPYASTWGNPSTNDSCGNNGVTEGLLPLASGEVTSGTACSARWTTATATKIGGTGTTFSGVSCTANTVRMRCQFTYNGRPIVRMTTTASNIAMGLRTAPTTGDITFTPASGNTIASLTPSIVAASGAGQVVLQVTMVNKGSSGTGRINVPHPLDSILLNTSTSSNPDLAWFINNQWQRYTYYAISPAVSANPSGVCTSANVTNCLTLTNAETGTGNTNDKRIALILSGRPLGSMTQPSANRSAYFEAQNDQTSTPGDRNFQRDTISATFNDRPAVCPFQRQTTGTAAELCN